MEEKKLKKEKDEQKEELKKNPPQNVLIDDAEYHVCSEKDYNIFRAYMLDFDQLLDKKDIDTIFSWDQSDCTYNTTMGMRFTVGSVIQGITRRHNYGVFMQVKYVQDIGTHKGKPLYQVYMVRTENWKN